MASLMRSTTQFWQYLFTEAADERSKGWFLTGSPFPILIIMVAYYRFVKISGPDFMKNRKPFNLDRIIQIYNIGQVLMCAWLSYESFTLTYGPGGSYNWSCQPMDTSLSPAAYRIATLTWYYYMLKITDLLDTVFFVLRKKFNQVSFLHVYHHMGVLVLGYVATKYYPDGHGFILMPLNCFVHTIMYAYYFITNYNPEYKKNLWWKKYITQIQIIQFFILTVHMIKIIFMPTCKYPMLPIILFLPQNLIITVLFLNFYIKTYLQTNKPLKAS